MGFYLYFCLILGGYLILFSVGIGGPPNLLYNGYRVFAGGEVLPGRDADPSPPSSVEVKNRLELYLYSP